MSTKIYNGYCLPKLSLDNLYSLLLPFGEKIREEAKKQIITLEAKLCSVIIDDIACGIFNPKGWEVEGVKLIYREENKTNPIIDVNFYLYSKSKKIKTTNYRDDIYDFSCSVSLIPISDKILALFYGEKKEYREIWEKISGVKPYSYWDNTDRPEELSDVEWSERGDEWDKALGEESIPALVSFNFDAFCDQFPYPSSKDILPHIPSFDKRVDCVLDKVSSNYYMKINGKEKLTINNYYDFFSQFLDWQKTEEGTNRMKEMKNEVKSKLKENLTKEDLINDLTF
jgi:hypothetical protein